MGNRGMNRFGLGGLAVLTAVAYAGMSSAQIHDHPHPVQSAAPPAMSPPPPPQPRPPGMAPAHAMHSHGWRSHRFHDCMSRYHDLKGCRYLVWRRR